MRPSLLSINLWTRLTQFNFAGEYRFSCSLRASTNQMANLLEGAAAQHPAHPVMFVLNITIDQNHYGFIYTRVKNNCYVGVPSKSNRHHEEERSKIFCRQCYCLSQMETPANCFCSQKQFCLRLASSDQMLLSKEAKRAIGDLQNDPDVSLSLQSNRWLHAVHKIKWYPPKTDWKPLCWRI